jgi:hypothetical protein
MAGLLAGAVAARASAKAKMPKTKAATNNGRTDNLNCLFIIFSWLEPANELPSYQIFRFLINRRHGGVIHRLFAGYWLIYSSF